MSNTVTNDDSSSTETISGDTKRKRFLLRQMLLYSFVNSVATEIWPSLLALFAIPLLVMAVMWCFADSRESGHPIGRIWGVMLLLAFAIVFPVYVFRTHGMSGFKVLLFSIVYIGIVSLCLNMIPLITLCLNR